MRRLVASLFGRKDDKQQRKDVTHEFPSHDVSRSRLRLAQSVPSNSSASSSTSFSVSTPDDTVPLPYSNHSRRWKGVFRNRKGSVSSNSLVRQPSVGTGGDSKYAVSVPHSRSSMMVRAASSVTDDDEDLSPPVRPFVRHRSSRSSEPSGSSNTNSPRSSRSSLVPLPSIPASPPPMTPHAYMHTVILRSLSRNPYLSPHPLLATATPASNNNVIINNAVTSLDSYLYPRSVNASNTLPPPTLTLPQHLARLRLFERLKDHIFCPAEERAISRASSLSHFPFHSSPTVAPLALSRQTSSLRITSGNDTVQEVEAKSIHNVDRTGVSRGLAQWVRRGGFEERCVVWTMDEAEKSYVFAPIQGGPVAALEFSEGMEAFAGLVDEDELVNTDSGLPGSAARSSLASNVSTYNFPNDRLTTPNTLYSSTASSGALSTPSLSPPPSSPAPSSISLSHTMPGNSARPIPSSYHAPASTLQRVPSLPKRRGVRFAPSVTATGSSSRPTSVDSNNVSSQSSTVPPASFERGHARRRSSDSKSPPGGPVVIVHPSTPADALEIEHSPPSPGSRGLVSTFGTAAPKQRAPFPRGESEWQREERERVQREREEKERELERRRKSSILQAQQARQRLQEEVAAVRKRRESYKLDGGSTSVRAQAAILAGDSSSLSYSSSSTNSSSQPTATKRTMTDSALGGSVGRRGRAGQMWDLTVDVIQETLPSSPLVKGSAGEPVQMTRMNSTQSGGVAAPRPRPTSLRAITTTYGTGTGSQLQQASSGGNLPNAVTHTRPRASLPAGAANGGGSNNGATASDRRSVLVPGVSGTGGGLSASLSLNHHTNPAAAKSSGTSMPTLPNSSSGLPRRRSLAPGDPSHPQRPAPPIRNSRESAHSAQGHGASLTSENLRVARVSSPPPVSQMTMYSGGTLSGTQQLPMAMQMPMLIVQPVAVPVYVPMPTVASGSTSALPRSQSRSSGLTPAPPRPIKRAL